MQKLNLPEYTFRYRELNNKTEIFDVVRKKFVALAPEEWVRQNFLHFLINEKNVPVSLIAVEQALKVYKRKKRSDIIIYRNTGEPLAVVECKAPEVKISQDAFDQIVRYNMTLKVSCLIVTNGIQHYCCMIDYNDLSYKFLDDIPSYEMMIAAVS